MLEIIELHKRYRSSWLTGKGHQAVEPTSFHIAEGESLGLVGESGSGKSTLARLLLKLISADGGRIIYRGTDISGYSMKQMRPLRRELQIMFQHPHSALNPRQTLLESLLEPVLLHRLMNKAAAREKALELMEVVGLRAEVLTRYPHQVSGGQIQRIVIARALMLEPKFLVLDEPASMLDVSVQAQVAQLLQRIRKEYGLTYLFISHDLALVRHMCDRIAVMKEGRIVELNESECIMERPQHPYTQQLVNAFQAFSQ
ncbi:dipeptide/oligopeptide/nickel ABC transporter ATP-binding protein [Paenibacillus sp. BIHB 4019]|uniref:Dipeptide/oligopeptide/nickel ABC transporter ATP-binding protein n=1 Tax=Paenibacillus sp. BIHB 4019 TaxID=1870819 RepID=A0A1B2DQN0_9BACL|nr:ATP-binding cassette domain-containing protein [Paenibacillus sp. BIHB 4019]ANY70007.1 dipeptide/oligopeptide/nickel ABC transporter ATP-binding protein [Paenibacillus sp. BIHB 4019]